METFKANPARAAYERGCLARPVAELIGLAVPTLSRDVRGMSEEGAEPSVRAMEPQPRPATSKSKLKVVF